MDSKKIDNCKSDYFRSLGPSDRHLKLTTNVGFDRLPNQVVNMSYSNGFSFNILIIGEPGVGKSSLIRTIFGNNYELNSGQKDISNYQEMALTTTYYDLCEANVKLKLQIIESTNYSNQTNRMDSANFLYKYIEQQMCSYACEELRSDRIKNQIKDNRIHLCLFVISPISSGLQPFDIVVMKNICGIVNLVPVIAKADVFTECELSNFKKKIMDVIIEHQICLYAPPINDPASNEKNKQIIKKYPLAIINADNGPNRRIRKFPWGQIDLEDDRYHDFNALKDLLIRVNMYDIIHTTTDAIYKSKKSFIIRNYNLKVTKIHEQNTYSTDESNKKLHLENQLLKLKNEYNDLKEKITAKFEKELSTYNKACDELKSSLKDINFAQKENAPC